jgi:hypothetical protein
VIGHPVLRHLAPEDLIYVLGFLRVYDTEQGEREVLDELARRPRPLAGRRVRLIRSGDPHTRLEPGTEGTVDLVDSLGTVHVTWDDGHSLGLVPGDDFFEFLAGA